MTNLSGINVPAFVRESAADNAPVFESVISVSGISLNVRKFADDYVSVGQVGVSTHFKATRKHYGTIFGFISGLTAIMDNVNGTYVAGFHSGRGLNNLHKVYDETKNVAYVNWTKLTDESVIAGLAQLGYTKPEETINRWIVLNASKGRVFKFFTVEPKNGHEMNELKAIQPASAFKFEQDRNDYWWNIQNKHDGIELVLRVLRGENFVGLDTQGFDDNEAKRISRKFDTIFMTSEERAQLAADGADNGKIRNLLGSVVYAAKNNPEFVAGEFATESKATNLVTILLDSGDVSNVSRAFMTQKRVAFVFADGSRALPGRVILTNEALLDAALVSCENHGCLLTILE